MESGKRLFYLFVGDLHGNLPVLKSLLYYCMTKGIERDIYYHLVFVGDYADSLYHSKKETRKILELLLDIKVNPKKYYHIDDITILLGNHDIHYLDNTYSCSGFTQSKYNYLHKHYINLYPYTDLYFTLETGKYPILATHAGLSNHLTNEVTQAQSFDDLKLFLEREKEYFKKEMFLPYQNYTIINRCGYSSGGRYDVGGIFWNRPREFKFFEFPVCQVMGHTWQSSILMNTYKNSTNYYIDTLQQDVKQILGYNVESDRFFYKDITDFSYATEFDFMMNK